MTDLVSRAVHRIAARFRTSSRTQQAIFTRIMRSNAWGDAESVSGPGSTRRRGADFQRELIDLFDAYGIRSIVDTPCGDFNWMRDAVAHRELAYTGVDIVPDLIAADTKRYGAANRQFVCADMTRADLPAADLVLCRDGLVHLSFRDALAAVRNFQRSGSRYLLATTFVRRAHNIDVPTGGWRVLNLEAPPFSFPAPLARIDEHCLHGGGMHSDKHLALWELKSLMPGR